MTTYGSAALSCIASMNLKENLDVVLERFAKASLTPGRPAMSSEDRRALDVPNSLTLFFGMAAEHDWLDLGP